MKIVLKVIAALFLVFAVLAGISGRMSQQEPDAKREATSQPAETRSRAELIKASCAAGEPNFAKMREGVEAGGLVTKSDFYVSDGGYRYITVVVDERIWSGVTYEQKQGVAMGYWCKLAPESGRAMLSLRGLYDNGRLGTVTDGVWSAN